MASRVRRAAKRTGRVGVRRACMTRAPTGPGGASLGWSNHAGRLPVPCSRAPQAHARRRRPPGTPSRAVRRPPGWWGLRWVRWAARGPRVDGWAPRNPGCPFWQRVCVRCVCVRYSPQNHSGNVVCVALQHSAKPQGAHAVRGGMRPGRPGLSRGPMRYTLGVGGHQGGDGASEGTGRVGVHRLSHWRALKLACVAQTTPAGGTPATTPNASPFPPPCAAGSTRALKCPSWATTPSRLVAHPLGRGMGAVGRGRWMGASNPGCSRAVCGQHSLKVRDSLRGGVRPVGRWAMQYALLSRWPAG